MYYKILTKKKGRWCGGFGLFNYAPYLPKRGKPGKWTPRLKSLAMCRRGWHVTTTPRTFLRLYHTVFAGKVRVFQAKIYDTKATIHGFWDGGYGASTVCCSSIRLLKEIDIKGWREWRR
jgi:hypothetical protein